MSFIREKLIQICDKLPGIANTRLNTVSLEYVPCDGYKVGNTPPEDGWLPFPAGMQVRGNDSHYWFRCTLRTPPAKADTSYYVKFTTGYEGKWDATNPQGLVYANGEMVQGCDTNHTEVFLEPDTDYTLAIPLTQKQLEKGSVTVYSYCDGKVEKLKVKLEDNLCIVTLADIEKIIVVPGDGVPVATIITGVLAVLIAGVVGVMLLKRKKSKP